MSNAKAKKKEELLKRLKSTYEKQKPKQSLSSAEILRILLTLTAKKKLNIEKQPLNRANITATEQPDINNCFYIVNNENNENEPKKYILLCDSKEEALIFTENGHCQSFSETFMEVDILYEEADEKSLFKLQQENLINSVIDQQDGQFVEETLQHLTKISESTRPDLCATISIMNVYPFLKNKVTKNRKESNCYRKLCDYLNESVDKKLRLYPNQEGPCPHDPAEKLVDIVGYCDGAFKEKKEHIDKYLYQKGYFILLLGSPIAWASEKEEKFENMASSERDCHSLEFYAQDLVTDKIAKIKTLLRQLNFNVNTPSHVYCDNLNKLAGIKRKENNESSIVRDKNTKTVRAIDHNEVTFKYVPDEKNAVDWLTREIDLDKFNSGSKRVRQIMDFFGLI